MPRPIPEGVHEQLITREIADGLERLPSLQVDARALNAEDAPAFLARHIAREVERALRDTADEGQRLALIEKIVDVLGEHAGEPDVFRGSSIAPPSRVLQAIYKTAAPPRPASPLSLSTLLTRSRHDPTIGYELRQEIGSANEIELIAAFITVGGVRVVREALEAFSRRGGRLRVLTTVFTGTTEVEALDMLARLEGAEVRVSYDVRRTRLHAKAWLFRRDTELHTAYVGSANLTSTALGVGQEWMMKVCGADLPHVIDKFGGTFESLWNDGEFEPYDPSSELDRTRLRRALRDERVSGSEPTALPLFTLRPFPFQEEILDRLQAERELHQRRRNLVVAATGTGKTVIAAFDYARYAASHSNVPRLLFLAHRRELLEQACATLRQVMRDGSFGELLSDGEQPERWEHVFATIQTASRVMGDRLKPDHFRYVVVDECHHAPAESYQRLLEHLTPDILLGLTATPERSDGKSLLPDFDGRIAAELRLWHALERQLLVPFEYYGVADATDLSKVRWTRAGYAASELTQLYTGNEGRVDLILEQLRRRVTNVRSVRALAFCVSVEHAEFMARALSARGVPAMAVHGGSSDDERANAPKLLEKRDVNVLCTCDLYNEGVDLPYVDALLLLRPTASPTVFMQQLGRGLRQHTDKQSCLVLDFIGQHRAEYRLNDIFAALTGLPRGRLVDAVSQDFPFLPSGCVLSLDAVARDQVLASLRAALPTAARLAREVREVVRDEQVPTLGSYLAESGRELEDVYRVGGWSKLLAAAGLSESMDEEQEDLGRRLEWLLHVDEPERLRVWGERGVGPLDGLDARRLTMLDFQLNHRGVLRSPEETLSYLKGQPMVNDELRQLSEVLLDRVHLVQAHCPVPEWPLALHRHYSRREIAAAVGFVQPGQKGKIPQGGVLKLEEQKRELMLVTLDKSGKTFSPTTRYRDYAISPTLFHWETQAIASVSRPSGRRYLDSPGNGWAFHLFVRTDPDAAYAYLGPTRLQSHTGDRPIAITWELLHAMPGELFERFGALVV